MYVLRIHESIFFTKNSRECKRRRKKMSEETKKQQSTAAFYSQTQEQVMQDFGTSAKGLSESEAKKRLVEYGKNELDAGKKKSMLQKFFEQFKEFLQHRFFLTSI